MAQNSATYRLPPAADLSETSLASYTQAAAPPSTAGAEIFAALLHQ